MLRKTLGLNFVFVVVIASAAIVTSTVYAADKDVELEHSSDANSQSPGQLHVSKTYNGAVPIDLSKGPLFTNGTFGDLDPAREEAVKGAYTAPGLFAASYPFAQKDHFVDTIDNLLQIYREGLENLKANKDGRAETVEYRQVMSQNLKERLAKVEGALKEARTASAQTWDEKQKTARNAFVDLQALLVRAP